MEVLGCGRYLARQSSHFTAGSVVVILTAHSFFADNPAPVVQQVCAAGQEEGVYVCVVVILMAYPSTLSLWYMLTAGRKVCVCVCVVVILMAYPSTLSLVCADSREEGCVCVYVCVCVCVCVLSF